MEDPLTVLKFGGASVATCEAFERIASIISKRAQCGRLVVVVSAMGDMTDQLIAMARSVHPRPPQREMDMLVSVGERISIALLAMALDRVGIEAVSFTGSQSGILTTGDHEDARIIDVRPVRLLQELDRGRVVIVAGFQGVSAETKEITTLGRGGSDTTAVALGVSLEAACVDFYKDVGGIYDKDPKRHGDASPRLELTYEEALAIANAADHPVLHPRSLQLAACNGLLLRILSFQPSAEKEREGTRIGGEWQGKSSEKLYEAGTSLHASIAVRSMVSGGLG